MTIFKPVRILVLAGMLALAISGVPALRVPAHAAASCEDGGNGGLCISCHLGDVWYDPGEQINAGGRAWMCDGNTGHWVLVGFVAPRTGLTPSTGTVPH
jgi:hypothetical protein